MPSSAALPFSADVNFFGIQRPPLGPSSVQLIQQEFAHDVAVLQFWADDVISDSYQSGMPMTLTFGRSLSKRLFYGYVNHVSRVNNSLSTAGSLVGRNSTIVTCAGASWFMKQTSNRTWVNQTASQIVAQIAQLFGLATNIVDDSTVWPLIPQAGMSYWQFCVALAKRIGYTFYCSGVTLVFKPRQTNPLQVSGLVAQYDYRNDPAAMPQFMPTLGATSPTGGELANRKMAGVNPRTNQVTYSTVSGSPQPAFLGLVPNTPVFNKTEHATSNSQSENQQKLKGMGQSNQFYLTASAMAAGNPLISQGSLISVVNANGSQNGLWFVEKAKHCLDVTSFTTEISLGRDSLGVLGLTRPVSQISSANTTAVLSSGKWVSV